MKIILIGFMGSGKTSVANELGQLLKLPTVEMDELVFQKTNTKNMNEVFAKGGELLLRETEIEIAREHASATGCIISTGAGVIMNKIILDYLKMKNDMVVFLNAKFQTLTERLTADTSRPLFQDINEAQSLFHLRQPLYIKYSDHAVEVDNKTVEQIALEIKRNLHQKGHQWTKDHKDVKDHKDANIWCPYGP